MLSGSENQVATFCASADGCVQMVLAWETCHCNIWWKSAKLRAWMTILWMGWCASPGLDCRALCTWNQAESAGGPVRLAAGLAAALAFGNALKGGTCMRELASLSRSSWSVASWAGGAGSGVLLDALGCCCTRKSPTSKSTLIPDGIRSVRWRSKRYLPEKRLQGLKLHCSCKSWLWIICSVQMSDGEDSACWRRPILVPPWKAAVNKMTSWCGTLPCSRMMWTTAWGLVWYGGVGRTICTRMGICRIIWSSHALQRSAYHSSCIVSSLTSLGALQMGIRRWWTYQTSTNISGPVSSW